MYELNVGCINARSILPHLNDIKSIINEKSFDIFLICESWLKDTVDNSYLNINGFTLYRADRNARGRGLCIYVKNGVKNEIFVTNQTYIWENLWVKLVINKRSYAVGVIYKPHEQSTTIFLDEFEDMLASIVPTVNEIICMGDFNLDLIAERDSIIGSKFLSITDSFKLSQIIDEPTRITGRSESLIDYVIVREDAVVEKGVIHNDFSDHAIVFCKLNSNKLGGPKMITYRDFKYFNEDDFLNDLFSIPFFNIYDYLNVDEKIEFIVKSLQNIFNKHAPVRMSRITKPRAPWLTYNLKQMISERERALKRYKKSKLERHLNYYRDLRNYINKAVKNEKKAYFHQQFLNKSTREMWKTLKSNNFINTCNHDLPTNLKNPTKLNEYFVNSVQSPNPSDDIINFYLNNRIVDSNFSFEQVTEEFVYKTLKSIKTNAMGCDEINIKIIRLCCPHIVPYITHIVNHCLTESVVPSLWRQAVVQVIPKKSNPLEYKDLRAISILPTLSKVLEKAMEIQIKNHIANFSLLPSMQSGFRKGYSCSTALLHIVDDIVRAFDKGKYTILVLLDFSRAFDTINHSLFLSILQYIGFSENACSLLGNFVTNRKQRVRIDDNYSTYLELKNGVPQGSVLGPLIFSIYSANIVKTLKKCSFHLYADDTQLYYSFPPHASDEASAVINRELSDFVKSATDHSLLINAKKTNVMLFGPKSNYNAIKSDISLYLNNEKLSIVSEAKNLGVLIDTELKFEKHINKLLQKAYSSIKIIYGIRQFLSSNVRKILCESLVLSLFNYSDTVYGPCLTNQFRNKIQKVQNSCLRLIYGIKKRQRISHKLAEIGWLSMENRRKLHSANLYHRILHSKAPPYLHRKVTYRTDVHNMNVRSKGLLSPPLFRTEFFRRSFTYQAYKLYNSIPETIKVLPFLAFKSAYRKFLLSS